MLYKIAYKFYTKEVDHNGIKYDIPRKGILVSQDDGNDMCASMFLDERLIYRLVEFLKDRSCIPRYTEPKPSLGGNWRQVVDLPNRDDNNDEQE